MTPPTTPHWIALHGGELRRGLNDHTWLVLLSSMQEYAAVITPAAGKFTCAVTQRNNGKRLDKGTAYPTAETALQGGLEELKQALGWG